MTRDKGRLLTILIIIPSYKPAYIYGGPILSVSSLAEALSKSGNTVTVYTTTANGSEDLEVIPGKMYSINGVTVYYFNRWTKGHSNFSPGLLNALFANLKFYDIVYIQSWWNLVTIPVAMICIRKGVIPILSPRGTLTGYSFEHNRRNLKGIFHNLLGKNILNRITLIFTSEREKEQANAYIQSRHNYIIPNLLKLPEAVQRIRSKEDKFRILFLGRIDQAKNLELLLKVLDKVVEFSFECIIAGEGPIEYVKRLKSLSSGVTGISWIGNVEGDEKYKHLAEADLLVLPSYTENYGNVVFEALSQGTAVMVSANVGAKDYITKNNLGWVVNLDEEEWRETLVKICENIEARADIRLRGPRCIARDFNETDQVAMYMKVFMEHLQRNNN